MTKETRVTSKTGGAKGDKIYRFDQIPAGPMKELAARYGLGSTKYPAVNGLDNWRNGYPFSLSLAALERHLNAFKDGEDNDSTIYAEAGLLGDDEDPLYDAEGKLRPGVSHLAAAVWHCFFLMHHLEAHPELDDRPSTVEKRNAETPKGGEVPPGITFYGGPNRRESDFIAQTLEGLLAESLEDARRAQQFGSWHKHIHAISPESPESRKQTETFAKPELAVDQPPAKWRSGVGEPWREIYPGPDGVYQIPVAAVQAPEVTVKTVTDAIHQWHNRKTGP